jgi:argininosuccinate lyase
VQVSSIMPQKRNPVALEHARALASRALAETSAVAHIVHNTPWGDIVDTEDDLQPLVLTGFRNAVRATGLVSAVCAHMEFDVERMRDRAGDGWVTVTELADALVRERGLPFTRAHAIVTGFVGRAVSRGPDASRVLNDVARELGEEAGFTEADLDRYLSPEHFVAVRRTHGGPAPEVVEAAIDEARSCLETDAAWAQTTRTALADADAARAHAVDVL